MYATFTRDRDGLGNQLPKIQSSFTQLMSQLEGTLREDQHLAATGLREEIESGLRKWKRLGTVLNHLDEVFQMAAEEKVGLEARLEEKDMQIAELREQIAALSRRKLTPEEIQLGLDAGVAEEEWPAWMLQPWPAEAFMKTGVVVGDSPSEEIGNLILIKSPGDKEVINQLLQLDLPKTVKNVLKEDTVESGNFAKVVNREILTVGGQQKEMDTVFYVVNYEAAEDEFVNAKNLALALKRATLDAPDAQFTFCTRTRAMNSVVRKWVELHSRRTKNDNRVWYSGRRRKSTGENRTSDGLKNTTDTQPQQQHKTSQEVPTAAPRRLPSRIQQPQQQSQQSRRRWEQPSAQAAHQMIHTVAFTDGDFPALGAPGGGKARKPANKPKRPVVFIQTDGRSAGEMNRFVRETVGDLAHLIVDAGMTRDGRMKIEVETAIGAERLQKAIERKAPSKAVAREPILRLVVRRLDNSLTEDDLTEELKVAGLDVVNVRIPANAAGIAFIGVKDNAKSREVLNSGSVRICFATCPVREYQESNVCYRCHEAGHIQYQCKSAVDYSKCCRKCKKEGHIARDCQVQNMEIENGKQQQQ
ncbi:unnamed protein product [Bemisia tabaci]|uniref:CCHC-type domain-containing protein n=1 Tax=Bemisia tabaci TaxID=7038 RepID=A0A9P0EYQ9_BEMTA|nr:unnamed protein product [Bemisia tabaci]